MIYDKKQIFKCLFILTTLTVAMNLTNGIGFAFIIPLALLSLTRNKPDDVFFYILAMVSTVIMNPRIAHRSAIFFIEQRVMLMGLGLLLASRAASSRRSPLVAPFMGMMIYVAYMAITSSAGWCPIVSYLKLALFSFTYLAYFGAANASAIHPRGNVVGIRSVILSIAAFFLLGSVALIPVPSLGMMNKDMFLENPGANITSLFMGMTSHSQCLGPIVSGLATILFADFIFGVRRMSKLYILLLACCPILIWKTSSRTAMGTFLSGIMFASYFFMRARWVGHRWRGRVLSFMWIGAIFLAVAVACSGSMRQSATRFIQKNSGAETMKDFTIEDFTSSRMGLVENALYNFRKSPVFGNGFQVSDTMAGEQAGGVRLLSAPIEKGVWVTAILEEGGVIGFVIFTLFLLIALMKTIKHQAFVTASVFFVLIVSNLGEFTFFSVSYSGGFMWALVFASMALDAARLKSDAEKRRAMFAPPPAMFAPPPETFTHPRTRQWPAPPVR